MNHDATHCADYSSSCPVKCYRAELIKDLQNRPDLLGFPLSFAKLKFTKECPKWPKPPKDDD